MSCCLQQKLINHNGDCVHKKLHVSLFQTNSCFSPLSRKLDVGWPRIEDFQLRGHSCVMKKWKTFVATNNGVEIAMTQP